MRLGVTATQNGLTLAQLQIATWLFYDLEKRVTEFHHGGCIGGDFELQEEAAKLGWRLVMHRGDTPAKWADCVAHEVREPLPNLVRNKNIVNETDAMVACPAEMKMILRSGTWSTIRYAQRIGRPLAVILQDGQVLYENWASIHP